MNRATKSEIAKWELGKENSISPYPCCRPWLGALLGCCRAAPERLLTSYAAVGSWCWLRQLGPWLRKSQRRIADRPQGRRRTPT